MSRICKDCNVNKELCYFEFTNKTKNLYRKICKKCRVIKRKEYMKNYYISKKVVKDKPQKINKV